MPDDGNVKIPMEIPKADFQRAILAAAEGQTQALSEELNRALSAKGDEIRKQMDDVYSRIDGLSEKVAAKTGKVDEALDKLQSRVDRRVNTYVIPAVVFTFIAIVMAIFAALGGFGVIKTVETLKEQVNSANTTFSSTNSQLATLTKNVNDSTKLAETERMIALTDQIEELKKQIKSLETKLPPPPTNKAGTNK
jgi:predicted  nucleic acid-binding Zn-ribbon protein